MDPEQSTTVEEPTPESVVSDDDYIQNLLSQNDNLDLATDVDVDNINDSSVADILNQLNLTGETGVDVDIDSLGQTAGDQDIMDLARAYVFCLFIPSFALSSFITQL